MDESERKAHYEAFLAENASEEVIVEELANVLRELMRAVSSDGYSSGAGSAAKGMKLVGDLLAHSKEPLSWHRLLLFAVDSIKEKLPDNPYDRKFIDAAMRGIKYVAESSATDNAAKGRASKRRGEFEQAIRWALE